MSEAKATRPTQSLLQGAPYVPAVKQQTEGVLARWLWSRSEQNPWNYEADVLAEKNSMQIRSDRP